MTFTSRSSHTWKALSVAIAVLCCTAPLAAQTPGFTSFDAPHAGMLNNQGTIPTKINAVGTAAGYYIDAGYKIHGFLRTVAGTFTEFDATGLSNTVVSAINSQGQVVGNGNHVTARGNYVHGYLRFATGRCVQINFLGANSTLPLAINGGGEVAGWYGDADNAIHGFVRDAKGNYTSVDDPDAVSGKPDSGTFVTAIDNSGTVAGHYGDSAGVVHGFVLDQFGSFTNFDAPDAGTCIGCGTISLTIDDLGEVTGYYVDNSPVAHAFLRDNLGNITEFSVPNARETVGESTNNLNKSVGQWTTTQNIARGFVRDSSGVLSSFSVPVVNFGTIPNDINDSGQITGFYIDDNGANHGFLQ